MDHQQDDGASSVRSYSSGNTRERPTAASSTANRRIHSYSYSLVIVIVSKRSIEDIQTELSISMWRKTAILSASISPSQ